MKVAIGRDLELDVNLDHFGMDEATLTPATAHVFYIGLRNILMDAHAGAAKVAQETGHPDSVTEIALGMAQKKLDALYAGDLRRTGGGGGRKADAVRNRALAMATEFAKRKGHKGKDAAEYAKKLVDMEDSRFVELAREAIEREAAEFADLDIDI
jgi:hypothetical protein